MDGGPSNRERKDACIATAPAGPAPLPPRAPRGLRSGIMSVLGLEQRRLRSFTLADPSSKDPLDGEDDFLFLTWNSTDCCCISSVETKKSKEGASHSDDSAPASPACPHRGLVPFAQSG